MTESLTGTLAILAALVAGYLLGSIPSAQLFARLKGRDIFETGSGNMGTMNALRNVGPLIGVLTLLFDVAKGTAAVLLAGVLAAAVAPELPWAAAWAVAAGALGAVVGHIWSLFAGFRGGKALAVALGVLLPSWWLVGVAGVAALVLLVLLLRNVDLASILTVCGAALAVWWLSVSAQPRDGLALAFPVALAVSAALISWRHLTKPGSSLPVKPRSGGGNRAGGAN